MNSIAVRDNWLAELYRFSSVRGMREALFERNPGLTPPRLKRLAILGAGPEGKRLAKLSERYGIEVVAAYDGNVAKRGLPAGSSRVLPSDALGSLDRSVPVIIASHRALGGMDVLRGLGFTAAPFAMLQVMAPDMFPPHMFYDGLLEDLFENRDRYLNLAGGLDDEESRHVLNAVVGYRLTLEPSVLRDVIDWDLYGASGLLAFDDHEVYVDGGSYDGDSVRMFIDHANGKFDRILAFEPDPATFGRLTKNFHHEPRIQTFNAGLYRAQAMLSFENDATRGAIFTETGTLRIPVLGLDEVLNGDRVTFIKMNIEGSELEALKGGVHSIRKWNPKLAISLYHRPTDLWRIPEFVRTTNPDYRFYLRQHDGGIIETVLYACPRTN